MTIYDLAERVERLHPEFERVVLVDVMPSNTLEFGYTISVDRPFEVTIRVEIHVHVAESIESPWYRIREVGSRKRAHRFDVDELRAFVSAFAAEFAGWRARHGRLVYDQPLPLRDYEIKLTPPYLRAGFVGLP